MSRATGNRNVRSWRKALALTKEEKTSLIKDFQRHEGDVGSPEVQVAMLTFRIKHLTAHLAVNKHDFGTRRGLLRMVSRRRSLLSYLMREDVTRYRTLIDRLGLKK